MTYLMVRSIRSVSGANPNQGAGLRGPASAAGGGHRLGPVSDTIAERYVRVGLRLGRHVEGIVDSYCGPPELAAEVDAEPLRDPAALASGQDSV